MNLNAVNSLAVANVQAEVHKHLTVRISILCSMQLQFPQFRLVYVLTRLRANSHMSFLSYSELHANYRIIEERA